MEHWFKNIELIKESDSPLELTLTIIFRCLGRETWLKDPLIQTLIQSPEFKSSNIYQNEKRTCEVIYSCFTLLKNEIFKGFEQHLIILIMAALFHNFKHSGHMNRHPFENEKIAIEQMYEFAKNNNIMKLWDRHPWMNLKNMSSWVNSTDAIEELIFCSDFSDVKNIEKNYFSASEDLWRSDLPIQINKLKQIYIEALLLPNVLEPVYIEENKKMMIENGIKGQEIFFRKQIQNFLQNFAIHRYVSQTSQRLNIKGMIEKNIQKILIV